MSAVTFLERLDADDSSTRWLVLADGADAPHVRTIIVDSPELLDTIERDTRPWLGAIHARMTQLRSLARIGDQLVIDIDDDRGPSFIDAAQQLADPSEREAWCVAQIVGIGDALATLRQRTRGFVHRRIDESTLYLGVDGHVRLRAPVAVVELGERPDRMGAGILRRIPAFLSPEQAMGRPVDATTDVFALAGHLYAALSGALPYPRGESEISRLQDIIVKTPAPLTLSTPGLAAVIERGLAKRPLDRYPDPGTFAGELWRCIPDAMDYDAVVCDRLVAWLATVPSAPPAEPLFDGSPCKLRWDQLAPTDRPDTRHCGTCAQQVIHVRRLDQIVPLAGACVHYTGG